MNSILRRVGRALVKDPIKKIKLYRVYSAIFKKEERGDSEQNKIDLDKFSKDRIEYEKINTRTEFAIKNEYMNPILTEYRQQAGYPGSYFWQDLWGAKKVLEQSTKKHFDIGSRIDGFISHLMLNKLDVTLIDIRPLDKGIPGVHFIQADATNLNGIEDNSLDSISALCSFEHFGLGRYGDEIDPEACFKAFSAIQRVTRVNGYIYISVPIGKERVCFNAHRVFCADTIINAFNQCELIETSVVDTSRFPVLQENVDLHEYDEIDMGIHAGAMGLFIFKKR